MVDTILGNVDRFFRECEEAGRCRIVRSDTSFTKRAGILNRIARACISRRKMGPIAFDLELLAVAEANNAVFLTHDWRLYRVYRACLHGKTRLPSFHYLAIETSTTFYKICGDSVPELETALREAASKTKLTYRGPETTC